MNYIPLFLLSLVNFPLVYAMNQNMSPATETVQTLTHRAWFLANKNCYQPVPQAIPDRLALYGINPAHLFHNLKKEKTLNVAEQKPISCPIPKTQLPLHCTDQEYEQKEKDLSIFLTQLHNSNDLFADALNIYLKFLTFDSPTLPLLMGELEKEDYIMRTSRNNLQEAEDQLQKRFNAESQQEYAINLVKLHATNLQTSLKKLMALELTIRLCQLHQNYDSAYASISKTRMQPFENWALNKVNNEKTAKDFYEK